MPRHDLGRGGSRGARRLAAVLGAALLLAAPPVGAAPSSDKGSGAFDVVLDAAHRCRVTLRRTGAGSGFGLAMPPGCRHALPGLGNVASWSPASDGGVRFDDASGSSVLAFAPGASGLAATGPQGESYRLEAADARSRVFLERVAAAPAGSAKPASAARPAPKEADLAGHYAVIREKGKDTGCMVTLDGEGRGAAGTLKAHLAPACRDPGIVIFDPVGWKIDRGRLVLAARKGHVTHLDLQDDGSWLKDPKEGKILSLKKIP